MAATEGLGEDARIDMKARQKKRDFTKTPIVPEVSVSRQTHRRLKELARYRGMHMTECFEKLILGELARHEGA